MNVLAWAFRGGRRVPTATSSSAALKSLTSFPIETNNCFSWLHHYGDALARPRDAGVEPPISQTRKAEALVDQQHVRPLRALRLVHRERVAIGKLLKAAAVIEWR